MLKLLVFAPCERVIVSQDGTTSLITLLEALTINLPADADEISKLPEDAAIPISWWICTLWMREDEDIGKTFEQKIELLLPPDNHPSKISVVAPFSVTAEHKNFRNLNQIGGFPLVRTEGTCLVKVSLREAKENVEWLEIATFPIYVKHQ